MGERLQDKERAVLVSDGEDRHMFLDYEGTQIEHLIDSEEYVPGEANLIPPGVGFWIWEGTLSILAPGDDPGEEYAVCATGEWRIPNCEEWAAIQLGDSPWEEG